MSEKDWFIVAAVVLVLFSLGSFGMMGFGGTGGWGGMMRSWGYSSAWFGSGWFFSLVCLAVLAIVGWLLIKALGRHGSHGSPRAALKMRLAKGEISKKQFIELSKVVDDDE